MLTGQPRSQRCSVGRYSGSDGSLRSGIVSARVRDEIVRGQLTALQSWMGLQIEVGVCRVDYLAVDHETRPTVAGLPIGATAGRTAMDRPAKHVKIEETDL